MKSQSWSRDTALSLNPAPDRGGWSRLRSYHFTSGRKGGLEEFRYRKKVFFLKIGLLFLS
jgi:hypothetical protein